MVMVIAFTCLCVLPLAHPHCKRRLRLKKGLLTWSNSTFAPSSTLLFFFLFLFEGRGDCLLIKTSRGSRTSSWFSRPPWAQVHRVAGVCLMVPTFPGAATMLYNSSRGWGRRGHGMGGRGEGVLNSVRARSQPVPRSYSW